MKKYLILTVLLASMLSAQAQTPILPGATEDGAVDETQAAQEQSTQQASQIESHKEQNDDIIQRQKTINDGKAQQLELAQEQAKTRELDRRLKILQAQQMREDAAIEKEFQAAQAQQAALQTQQAQNQPVYQPTQPTQYQQQYQQPQQYQTQYQQPTYQQPQQVVYQQPVYVQPPVYTPPVQVVSYRPQVYQQPVQYSRPTYQPQMQYAQRGGPQGGFGGGQRGRW